jgi:hypothetical protein
MSLTDAVDAGFARGTDEGVRAYTGGSASPSLDSRRRLSHILTEPPGVVLPKN